MDASRQHTRHHNTHHTHNSILQNTDHHSSISQKNIHYAWMIIFSCYDSMTSLYHNHSESLWYGSSHGLHWLSSLHLTHNPDIKNRHRRMTIMGAQNTFWWLIHSAMPKCDETNDGSARLWGESYVYGIWLWITAISGQLQTQWNKWKYSYAINQTQIQPRNMRHKPQKRHILWQ